MREVKIMFKTKSETEKKKTEAKSEEQDIKNVESTPANVLKPFEDMDRMFDQFFSRNWMQPSRFDWPGMRKLAARSEFKIPLVDVLEKDSEVIVRAEVPGVDKKDLDISITDNTITIKGQTRKEEKEEHGDYHRCEISSGSFNRTLTLPTGVESGKAKAQFSNGMLEITIPKATKTERRSIKID